MVLWLLFFLGEELPAQKPTAQLPDAPQARCQPASADPTQLLIQSYLVGRNLPAELRLHHLAVLGYASVSVEPALTRLWAQEAFRLAFTLPMSWNRVAHEKNALAALAEVDPLLAFSLFDSMDATVPFPTGEIPEDLRAYGARTVFREYWKRKGNEGLDAIRAQAAKLGNSGQYPFLAMAPIIRDVSRQDQLKAHGMFGEAIGFYGRGWRTAATDEEFSRLLEDVWDVVPAPFQRQALQLIVRNMAEGKEPRHKLFLSRTQLEQGGVEFRSRAKKLLYSLLPRIREVDAHWAAQLTEADPDLRQAVGASGKEVYSEQVTIQNRAGISDADVEALRSVSFQRQKLARIAAVAESDPAQAMEMSKDLSDLAFRSQAMAMVAAAVGSKEPSQARALMERVRKDLDTIREPEDRLAILAALARAAGITGDRGFLGQVLEHAFDLGEELFSQDQEVHPGKTVEDVAGFARLTDLTTTGIKYCSGSAVDRVSKVSNELLRAHLLVTAAETLFAEIRGRPIPQP